jgi:hypothetical protein
MDTITIGRYYEVGGKLVYLYGYKRNIILGYDFNDNHFEWDENEFKNIARESELKDFPQNDFSDPKLAYSFDLFWDIKRPSQIYSEVWDDPDFIEIIEKEKHTFPKQCVKNSPLHKLLKRLKVEFIVLE